MDILAGMLAYVAGLAALFGALAVSFSVFFATPKGPLQAQPQSASAMLVRPSAPKKQATIEARAKQAGSRAEKKLRPARRVAHSARHQPEIRGANTLKPLLKHGASMRSTLAGGPISRMQTSRADFSVMPTDGPRPGANSRHA
jgi:hypothetical protein